jgi:hypothetical protein
MKLDYGLFMGEAEGFLDTRESRINAVINDFVAGARRGEDINDGIFQFDVFSNNDLDDVTSAELDRIKRAVENRLY